LSWSPEAILLENPFRRAVAAVDAVAAVALSFQNRLNSAVAVDPVRPGMDTLRIQEEFYLCREAMPGRCLQW